MPSDPVLLSIDAHLLPLHPRARASFETWLTLPEALVPPRPHLPGLIVVVRGEARGGWALACGFGAYREARERGAAVTAVAMPLSDDEVERAARGEVEPLLAAMRRGQRAAPRPRARTRSLLEDALRRPGPA